MSRSIKIFRKGGPEVLELVDADVNPPGEGEVLIKQSASGINMIDIHHRESVSGQFDIPIPSMIR